MSNQINFGVAVKKLPDKGNLAWEYNPFKNYRTDEDLVYYQDKLYTFEEFTESFKENKEFIQYKDDYKNKNGEYPNLRDQVKYLIESRPKTETPPVIYQKGEIVDFETDELDYDLKHPLTITPSYSYDDSVDLIINDGVHKPRLINSRFSAVGKNKYQIVDRFGEDDTNLYDKGVQFDVDTSLYKMITKIPTLDFLGVSYGGNLKIGNYHFYFKYMDDDGNESDFIAESGLVSVFIGNTPDSIHSGFVNENSFKKVRFYLQNITPGYQKIIIYYTRSTSEINQNAVTSAHRITQEWNVGDNQQAIIDITGYEPEIEVPVEEINYQYQIYEGVATQAVCQNRLFIANVTKPELDHKNLRDCALRFLPKINTDQTCNLNQLGVEYQGPTKNTYYDPNFIYKYTGYWPDEIYRFGIVFIMEDNTLSPVYNIRGAKLSSKETQNWTEVKLKDSNSQKRLYLSWDLTTNIIIPEGTTAVSKIELENSKGVVWIPNDIPLNSVVGITFTPEKGLLDYLKNELKVRGFFFVRQRRIPTTICQAYTIGVDNCSRTPVLPTSSSNYVAEGFITTETYNYRTLTDKNQFKDREGRKLTNEFGDHIKNIEKVYVRQQAAICPEYDVNSPYLNSLFTGSDFRICENYTGNYLIHSGRHFYNGDRNFINNVPNTDYHKAQILGIEDNVKLMSIKDNKFAARASSAEEVWRITWLRQEVKEWDAGAWIVRGSFGPYIAITGYEQAGSHITIKIPEYSVAALKDYFSVRYSTNVAYHAISDRIDINTLEGEPSFTCYRGDCYICQFTHRLNRNFVDPSTPTNDDIIDPFCWTDNIRYTDGVLEKGDVEDINSGDVNAVHLGMWVTIPIRCNMNLSVRSIDESQIDEKQLMGNCRGFFPYHPMLAEAAYKIPEAQCYNKGFEKSVSEKYNMGLADAPAYRNNFSTRIAYSNIKISSQFENAFRTFMGQNYRDYPMTYGSITKLVEFNGTLICVLEHGIYIIRPNERTLAADENNPVYINTNNVLPENPEVISNTFGSQWADSVIKTDGYVYGVDTVGKKIWRTNGQDFEIISDLKVQKFLNDNISLTERELTPIIGIRNVKTHYNKYKHDVMFTFYDNLEGFEEKVWNLCWNEYLKMFTTFYSWVPSFSENIYNMHFTFNRDTSKQISKLGNKNEEGITLDTAIFSPDSKLEGNYIKIGKLSMVDGSNAVFSIQRDNYRNDKKFDIIKIDGEQWLCAKLPYIDYCTEKFRRYLTEIQELPYEKWVWPKSKNNEEQIKYVINYHNTILYSDFDPNTLIKNIKAVIKKDKRYRQESEEEQIFEWILNNLEQFKEPDNWSDFKPALIDEDKVSWEAFVNTGSTKCYTNKRGLRESWTPEWVKDRKVTYLLNIRADISTEKNLAPSLAEYNATRSNTTNLNNGFYETVVAVIPEYNMQFLSNDFWKHGRAGLIDIQETLQPTHWYGEQHPFEFEFVVNQNPDQHKIFNNLQIISNNAEPESFHYEIVGDSFEFADDKKNMYIRQEATKELYQYNGADITYDHDYKLIDEVQRPILDKNGNETGKYDKSTILPLNYFREDTLGEVYDSYTHKNDSANKIYDYRNLAGGELVYDPSLDQVSIVNHSLGVDMNKDGRLRGNMQYKEDQWYVQINPLEIVQRNEKEWENGKVPYEINYFPPTSKSLYNKDGFEVPPTEQDRGVEIWNESNSRMSATKIKDKYIKIKIRYSGTKLAVIRAVYTLFTTSYS